MATSAAAKRVFINCPFDTQYKPLFDALVFAVHDLGFQARHALIDDTSPIRLDRIASEIFSSKYSVHDLCRVERSGSLKLPRFNMPFEAGIAYASQKASRGSKHLLLLDAQPYRYQASISDVAGLDPKIHNNDPTRAIRAVRQFLATKSRIAGLPGDAYIAKRHALFFERLPILAKAANITMREMKSWGYVNDLQASMVEWIRQNPP